jgi:hypothetical protein
MPTNTTTLSRRRLLASSMPALATAAAMAPVAASALTSHPAGAGAILEHLDRRRIQDLMRLLDQLDGMPKGEANKVLTAITETIECSMRNHEHDAPLLALKPKFDAAFDDWWARTEDSKQGLGRYPSRTDEEIDEWASGLAELTDEVMGHHPITREGLALQCRAMIMDGYGAWDDRTARFIGNMVLFFNWKLPNTLAVELLTWGQDCWADEDEQENEDSDKA